MTLSSDVCFLKGVGPRYAELLAAQGARTVGDLLSLWPTGYLDRGQIVPIGRAAAGAAVTVEGTVRRVQAHSGRHRAPTRVEVEDSTGRLTVLFFNQPWIPRTIHVGDVMTVSGEVRSGGELHPRAYEVADDGEEAAHAAGIVPRYGLGPSIPLRWFRRLMRRVVEEHAAEADDPLPEGLRRRRGLEPLERAIRQMHFPDGWKEREEARRSLSFEEFFMLQTLMALRRRAAAGEEGIRIAVTAKVDERIRARLPFRLTRGQEEAIAAIRGDLASGRPMQRLLQGDVGCGKTAVAAATILATVAAGHQAALMVPTEILAEQHHRTFSRWLEGSRVEIVHVRGRMGPKARAAALARAASGAAGLVIGTHALVERDVTFRSLALAVVDEQQRFGVAQRARLAAKGPRPHLLVMTATPIPRTLAMTFYGDLDASTIRDMPPGRRPVATRFEADRAAAVAFVREELRRGRQAFFVYPLIDDSDALPLKAAKAAHAELARALPECRVGLLHGKMKRPEKEAAMEEFRAGRTGLLVSTIVVEVGIDVPNASVMAIDHAERYGLAQLHQLRGRIGRGPHPSTCLLLGDPRSPEARARIAAMVRHADGFRLAEEDLKLRGPGELFGTRQSGAPFVHGDPVTDAALLEAARDDAAGFVDRDPEGARRLRERVGDRWKLADIG